MDLKEKKLSLQFYKYVCNIVGSEEDVRARRDIFSKLDIAENGTKLTCISSGSKAEGIDLKGSDYDRMINMNFIRVYENLDDIQCYPDKIILVMDTSDVNPGFTKLKLVNKSPRNTYILETFDWCETVGEETFISSKRVREAGLPDDMTIHGPCRSTPNGEYDHAECLRCEEWVTPAQQWIHRSRTTWPHYTLVTSALQYGVLFVPIGCKNSPNEALQWRISFSMAEKLLIYSFSHTQLLCYALMKIILKDIIKPIHGDLLCSYFIKTIMFWLSEEINPSEWKPENMISSFLDCVRRLVYCVEYKTCLHYFIPENNLFENRFTGNDHQSLLDTLQCVYRSPWISIFQTETFQNYRLQTANSHSFALSASALSCFSYIYGFYTQRSIYRELKHFANGNNCILKKDICAYILCVCYRNSIQSSDLLKFSDRNKFFYKQYKKLFGHFKISLLSDSVSSWLLVASLFYNCKRFLECIDIIDYCLLSCTLDKIYPHTANSLAEQTVFKQMKQTLGLLHAFKYLMIDDVCFQHPFSLLPDELIPLVDDIICFIPPAVYSYILRFLCCNQLGDYKGSNNALCDLDLTIQERYFIFPSDMIWKKVKQCIDIVRALSR